MENNNKSVVLMSYTPDQMASDLAKKMMPEFKEDFNQLIAEKAEEDERPLTMKEASDWLKIGTTCFSRIVNRGEIDFIGDRDNPRAKKLFSKKDLKAWLENNRQEAIKSIRNSISYEK